MKILVTGGCGFIGTNFIKFILESTPHSIINIDNLTYAAKGNNLKFLGLENNSAYKFYKGDITNKNLIDEIFVNEKPDYVVNFAAESHVDNSISGPLIFSNTNVYGTHVLLEAARKVNIKKFLHISTDEVYGSLTNEILSSIESDKLDGRSPYSASKVAAEQLVNAYFHTFNLPVVISRSSNNYGPFQFPEKLVPKFITNLIDGKKVPLMWSQDNPGMNLRDWLHVYDNCRALYLILLSGKVGEIYNVAGENEKTNIEITKSLLSEFNYGEEMIEKVEHRKGHDFRYSINCDKLKSLGFLHKYKNLDEGMQQTVNWYKINQDWWRPLI